MRAFYLWTLKFRSATLLSYFVVKILIDFYQASKNIKNEGLEGKTNLQYFLDKWHQDWINEAIHRAINCWGEDQDADGRTTID